MDSSTVQFVAFIFTYLVSMHMGLISSAFSDNIQQRGKYDVFHLWITSVPAAVYLLIRHFRDNGPLAIWLLASVVVVLVFATYICLKRPNAYLTYDKNGELTEKHKPWRGAIPEGLLLTAIVVI